MQNECLFQSVSHFKKQKQKAKNQPNKQKAFHGKCEVENRGVSSRHKLSHLCSLGLEREEYEDEGILRPFFLPASHLLRTDLFCLPGGPRTY